MKKAAKNPKNSHFGGLHIAADAMMLLSKNTAAEAKKAYAPQVSLKASHHFVCITDTT